MFFTWYFPCYDIPGHRLSIIIWAEFLLCNQQLSLTVIFVWGGGVWAVTCKQDQPWGSESELQTTQFSFVTVCMTSVWPCATWKSYLHWGHLLTGLRPPAATCSWEASWCWRQSGCCPQKPCSGSCPPIYALPVNLRCTPTQTQPKNNIWVHVLCSVFLWHIGERFKFNLKMGHIPYWRLMIISQNLSNRQTVRHAHPMTRSCLK